MALRTAVAKGDVVSFTFIGGNEDETEELLRDLTFGQAPPQGRGNSSPRRASHDCPAKDRPPSVH